MLPIWAARGDAKRGWEHYHLHGASNRWPVRVDGDEPCGSNQERDRERDGHRRQRGGAAGRDLNLWERPVTVGNVEGRAFAETQGDGSLDARANAYVASWPDSTAVGAGTDAEDHLESRPRRGC